MTMSENRQTATTHPGEYLDMDLDQDACYRAIELRDARFAGRFFTAVKTQRLQSIRGVGEWTAHYIALRQRREADAFLAADVGLMRALTDLEGRRRSSRELVGRADQWRPWRAYAAQHLWASL